MNLLVIDDNLEQLDSLALALKIKGYTVSKAKNGKEALAKLNDRAFQMDAVVTDYAMPEMDGLALLQKIRESDFFLPVIIMTAYGEKEILVQALRAGCDGYVEKPFGIDQLVGELERVAWVLKRRDNIRAFSQKVFKLIDTINDKLAIVSGNTEIAMIGLAQDDVESAKMRLNLINEVSKDISLIGRELLQQLGGEQA